MTRDRWLETSDWLLVASCWLLATIDQRPATALAQEPEPIEVAQAVGPAAPASPLDGLERQISLDLRGIDVIDALKFLAAKGDLNVVTTPAVGGQVTLFLKSVTIGDALDIILLTRGLALERRGTILTIMTEPEYEALKGSRYHDQRQARTIALKYATATKVASMLEGMRSSLGRIIADDATGMLVIMDVPERMDQMESAIQMLDLETVTRPSPTVSEVFTLQYNKAEDVSASVTAALTPTIGALQMDKKTNTLVVTDLPHRMPELRKLIAAFDQKTREVYIEAKILQVTLSDEFDLGIEWQTLFKNANITSIQSSFPASTALSAFGRAALGTLGKDQLAIAIKALQRFGKTDVLSTPHVAAVDGQEASIHVGTKEVYVTSTTSQGTSTATTSESVNFIDVGIKLNVTPFINEDGFVRMKIKPEVSSVSRTVTTAAGNTVPVVETSLAETTVLIKDGTTLVIGGLIKDRVALVTNQIPILGSLPMLGTMFRSKDDEQIKTELVVFLTPHIITGEHATAPPPVVVRKPFKEIAG